MSVKNFCWTDNAITDLKRIVETEDVKDRLNRSNWSKIAAKFKKLYPIYDGSIDAIRKQYNRVKDDDLMTKKFLWSPAAKKHLSGIVNSAYEANTLNWSNIATEFKTAYPNHEGNSDSLRKMYFRGEQNEESDATFGWTKAETLDLVRLANLICVDGYPNWTKISYTFKRYYPNFVGSKQDLISYYDKVCNDEYRDFASGGTEKDTKWDETLDVLLVQAIGHAQYIRSAQIRDGRKKNVDNLAKKTVQVFKEFYLAKNRVEYIGSDVVILKHFYKNKEALIPCSYFCDDDIDSISNIDTKRVNIYASKNHTLAFSKVFKECCHNCGFLFPRNRTSTNRKLLTSAINSHHNENDTKNIASYIYLSDGKFITCPECYKNPDWIFDYLVTSPIPGELRSLNDYEQNQIALCGGFYSLYRKQNLHGKIFEHRQGECNIGKKRDEDYHKVFIAYFNIERPLKLDTSDENIKVALRWLRRNNRLFIDFLSNYETIYGYLMSLNNLHPDERIIQISKGTLAGQVNRDTAGLFIPADSVEIESVMKPEHHIFGKQHPLHNNLNKLRDIINVNYSDPDLEAKRWPTLFPSGNGSWRRSTSLKQQNYVKHRLLGIDDRFRKTHEFMFFWYDRLIKDRLLYFNNRQRTVKVSELIEPIHVRDIRNNANRYGSIVPSSISGSKTYWRARSLDLLALVRDLGKPDLFVTLTQNDNWFELQESVGMISRNDLNSLDTPIMQPAIGGQSVVKFPVETVVAFYKRLEMFMTSCVHNKNGPFGEVLDYWFRIEYQNRGALHCHMILWICQDTIPADVVMAEMPRYSGADEAMRSQAFLTREYVKAFQLHTCIIGGCKKNKESRCKYGFPFEVQLSEEINDTKMSYVYMRHSEEDKNVVPYNMYLLLCWNGHVNVQKVTPNGIEAYLCKYVSKPEKSIDIKDITSDAEKFLKARVVGILECCSHLLQYHQVASSRKVLFIPCDFQPNQRMLKKKMHLPSDIESDDVYYQTLLYKYLVRPQELQNLTYVDMYRFYDVTSEGSRNVFTQSMESQVTDEESETEINQKSDESVTDFVCRKRLIRSQRLIYICNGYKYVERGKAAVPRWRFLMPFGNESEKYYEQRLLLNVPITAKDLNENGYPFSDDNESQTFVEECCLRGLVDSEETAQSALMGAIQRGFSVQRVIEIAAMFVDQSYVTKEYVDSIILPWAESMPDEENTEDDENEYGEELAKMIEMRSKFDRYEIYHDLMTDSQKNVMEWVDRKLANEDQILAMITGGAGVGKSFLIQALYSYFVEKRMVCVLLATTGSAAHLISGTTLHFYLKVDINGKKHLQAGTMSAKIVEDTDVIFIDEFSMLNSDLLDVMNECTKENGKSPISPFGGKHIFLIGDPCQLPSVGKSVFANPLLGLFSILLLKETVRQKDAAFAALLNRVRLNVMTDEDKDVLKARYIHVSNIESDDESLIVTATRKKMRHYNEKFIQEIPGDPITILAQDFDRDTNKQVSSAVKEKIRRYVKNLWDEQLNIKKGCIVRLLRNMDIHAGWVNSKRAKVFCVSKDGSYIVLHDINDPSKQLPLTRIRQPFKLGANLYYRLQYPLVLGYATTVHAVQGITVSGKYYVDLDRSFWESGQAFVALSRTKDLSQLFLLNTHFEKVYLKSYYKHLLEWMTDVDEISIMRKPRCIGDFPLITVEEPERSEIQMFPVLKTAVTGAIHNKVFKPPGKVVREKTVSPVYGQISSRLYKLADIFMNSCNTNTMLPNRIRFGVKFLNEVLENINKTLDIFSVTDPLLSKDDGLHVSQNTLRKWDEQKLSVYNLFRKYATQFSTEFETFANLISGLTICKYSGQELSNITHAFFRDNQMWQPVNTVGDGRCFYHSVSMNLIGNMSLSNSLKLILSFSIYNEYDIYEAILAPFASSAPNVLLKVLSYSCWADMEIITAMTYALQRPIIVVTGLDGNETVRDLKYNQLEVESEPMRIGFVKSSKDSPKSNHFIALLRDDSYGLPSNGNECISQQLNDLYLDSNKHDTIDLLNEDVEMRDANDSDSESL